MQSSSNISSFMLLVFAQIMVGVSIVGSKFLILSIPILSLLSMRFVLASLILFSLYAKTPNKVKTAQIFSELSLKDAIIITLQALTAGTCFNLLMAKGMCYTSASDAGIITSTLPAIVGVLSFIFLKEKFSIKKMMSLLFATVGLIIIGTKEISSSRATSSLLGDFIIFLALIPEAFYYILTKFHQINLPVLFLSGLINLINTIAMLPLMLVYSHLSLFKLTYLQGCILLIISFSSACFYVFWYKGCKKVDPIFCSISTSIMPVATLFLAWITMGEKIGWMQMTGVIFVLLSIIVFVNGDKKPRERRIEPST